MTASTDTTDTTVRSGTKGPSVLHGRLRSTGHLFRHQFLRTRRVWWTVVGSGLANPTLFLVAIGAGLGSQIDATELARLGTDSYIAWIGPGVLAVTAMEIGAREAMWPTMAMLRWEGTYRALLATPVSASHLGTAHVTWIGFRGFVAAVCFLAVLAVGGLVDSWWALLVPLVATLVAWAHGGPLAALTSRLTRDHLFPLLLRVVVFPLFLFSGAFFPVEDMPAAVAAFARLTPSWHGVEATRALTAGSVDASTLGHVGVLVAVSVVGFGLADYHFDRSMVR